MTVKTTNTTKETWGVMSTVEANHIKAKTRLMNHTNIIQWVRTITTLILGIVITLIGLVLFLKDNENYYFIALMFVGVFILSSSKPKIEDVLKNIQH